MDETLDKLGETIAGALPGSITSHSVANGELTIHAVARDIVKLATFLRDDERCQFLSLLDVTAVDWPGREWRFDVAAGLKEMVFRRIGHDEAAVIQTLVMLGQNLGISTLAEGIEQRTQLEYLQDQHIDHGQGFWLTKPLAPPDLEQFLHRYQPQSQPLPTS